MDGLWDGATVGAHVGEASVGTNPKNPDSDGDGLRDGQETAGWTVGIWFERTMEKKIDYHVASNPNVVDSDSDGMNDFSEFLNGSDPGLGDTDGDRISDLAEIEQKSNITGVEGTPPEITNVKLNVAIRWDWLWFLYLRIFADINVDFDIADNVGIDKVTVEVVRVVGPEVHTAQITAGTKSGHVSEKFGFSLIEALVSGAEVNISAYDVNGNGAWGQFHIDSVAEAVVKAIAALFAAIAKVIAEAASFLVNMFLELGKALIRPVLESVGAAFEGLGRLFYGLLGPVVGEVSRTDGKTINAFGAVFDSQVIDFALTIVIVVLAIGVIVSGMRLTPIGFVIALVVDLVVGMIIDQIFARSTGSEMEEKGSFMGTVLEAFSGLATGLDLLNSDTELLGGFSAYVDTSSSMEMAEDGHIVATPSGIEGEVHSSSRFSRSTVFGVHIGKGFMLAMISMILSVAAAKAPTPCQEFEINIVALGAAILGVIVDHKEAKSVEGKTTRTASPLHGKLMKFSTLGSLVVAGLWVAKSGLECWETQS